MEGSYLSAEALMAALRAGAVTSVELADEAIARIERDDTAINAICVPDFDRARAAARAADRARAAGDDRPLLGIPVTVKESYNVAGLPTTWGMPAYAGHLPSEDAVQVSRLKAAGAVVLGKTNVPLMLKDWQSFNELYGTTNNPWDHGRTPGGSSGGSAAALAAGFGALSIGSDLAGSLRVPAHFWRLDAAGLRAMVCSHRDWIEANDHREQHRHDWRRFFAEFDAVVCPITPTPAFPHDDNPNREERRIDVDGVAYPYNNQVVWAGLATMPGLPATAIPACRSPAGLPVGVQLIGPMFEDRTTLRLAELLEQTIGGFDPPK
jgi:Asp-tRNA(Asn)/Glu-tRNA(Gln) amidotransferase A subunit family amidase